MAAKRTSDLIPLCHQINLTSVDVAFELEQIEDASREAGGWVKVCATAQCVGGTGVEVRPAALPFTITPADPLSPRDRSLTDGSSDVSLCRASDRLGHG